MDPTPTYNNKWNEWRGYTTYPTYNDTTMYVLYQRCTLGLGHTYY